MAIKNGHHDPLGYYLDTERKPDKLENPLPLEDVFKFIMGHFD